MQTTTKQKRFFEILDNALQIGLETTVLKSDLEQALQSGVQLPEGFSMRDPNVCGDKPDAKTVSLKHPATSDGVTCTELIYFNKTLIFEFVPLPKKIEKIFQRINLKRDLAVRSTFYILGFNCGRFTMQEDKPEDATFELRLKNQNPQDKIGYLNLDFLSKTKKWNPLFIKCRLDIPKRMSETDEEYIYLRIGAELSDENSVLITTQRVSENKVPEHLKNSRTFPD